MSARLSATFVVIVIVPLVLLAWLGSRVALNEREVVRRRFDELLAQDLRQIVGSIDEFVAERERDLLKLTSVASGDLVSLRNLPGRYAYVSQCFLLDSKGDLLFPDRDEPRNDTEREFLQRTERIWADKDLLRLPGESMSTGQKGYTAPAQQMAVPVPSRQTVAEPNSNLSAFSSTGPSYGWYAWFWDRGLHLMFWQRRQTGETVGAELNRARFIADLIGFLPATELEGLEGSESRVVLRDSNGEVLYQWGAYAPVEGERPCVSLALDFPLHAWAFDRYLLDPVSGASGGRVLFSLFAPLAAVGIALLVLAVYFFRENTRELREASQRITFVNQVSHELKTPLTSIRMYAELLENQIPEEEGKTRKYLDVSVAESQRLSRLIGNILTFSRKQRSKLKLRLEETVVDGRIRAILDQFTPSLHAKGVKIEVILDAGQPVQVDRDALEQILGNLLNNVEKYGCAGGLLEVTSGQEDERTVIEVADNGPGVPWNEREKLFAPFYRVSNRLTDGVAGTGIGLTIARDLARLHGGDLVLLASSSGARFRLTLRTPRTFQEESHEDLTG